VRSGTQAGDSSRSRVGVNGAAALDGFISAKRCDIIAHRRRGGGVTAGALTTSEALDDISYRRITRVSYYVAWRIAGKSASRRRLQITSSAAERSAYRRWRYIVMARAAWRAYRDVAGVAHRMPSKRVHGGSKAR